MGNTLAIVTPQTSRGDATSWNHDQYMEMTDITDNELERNDIKFIRLLGSGNFGEVYKAVISDSIVAVKSLKGKTILDFKISSIVVHISK